VLNSREKNRYVFSAEAMTLYEEEIIPCRNGVTMRECIFNSLSDEWKRAHTVGVFTKFMEQRVPEHMTLEGKLHEMDLPSFKDDSARSLGTLGFKKDPGAMLRQEALQD
jgi:formate C-acetyltransferase